jgi:hypothetical protein
MKQSLFWRCSLCSPLQSHQFKVDGDPPVSECYSLVKAEHDRVSPGCIVAHTRLKSYAVAVDFLVRMVQ